MAGRKKRVDVERSLMAAGRLCGQRGDSRAQALEVLNVSRRVMGRYFLATHEMAFWVGFRAGGGKGEEEAASDVGCGVVSRS